MQVHGPHTAARKNFGMWISCFWLSVTTLAQLFCFHNLCATTGSNFWLLWATTLPSRLTTVGQSFPLHFYVSRVCYIWCLPILMDWGIWTIWGVSAWRPYFFLLEMRIELVIRYLVGALSLVNRKGLHQGWKQTSIFLLFIYSASHYTTSLFFGD